VLDNSLTADDVAYSLDDAYDNGGAGLGRTINADAGPVVNARNGCCAYVSGIPIGSAGLAVAHGWTVPCIIVEDIETLETVSWLALPSTP